MEPAPLMKPFASLVPLAVLVGLALNLQGCYDVYRDTCVWHSDLMIKGCSYYGYRHCIQHCHYCIKDNGPDECAQLKCAAYCAKRESDTSCLSNFAALCDIAVSENFQSAGNSCDVACNGAEGRKPPLLLGLLLLLVSLCNGGLPSRTTLLSCCVMALVAVSLHGCCTPPQPQLEWRPDGSEFNLRTRRIENGIWRGNPSWQWTPELEAEDYKCVSMHPTKAICMAWHTHEWNCGEQDFGVCQCSEIATDGDYCAAWGCHSLEADQEVCHWSQDNSDSSSGSEKSCYYDPFPMDWDRYNDIMARQAGGALTTGETNYFVWWSYSSVWSADRGRRLSEEETVKQYVDYLLEVNASLVNEALSQMSNATPRALEGNLHWPPPEAYSPVARHNYFTWGDVCIVNGDNINMAMWKCHQWREIETEISSCWCLKGHFSGKACEEWQCEEKDVGLFSILFRTRESIDQYVKGVESELYTCKQYNIDNHCTSWEGDIQSPEEAEWTSCRCTGSTCNELNAGWICDEWELPKTRDLFFEENRGNLFGWFFWEFFVLCSACRAILNDDSSGDSLFAVFIMSTCVSLCVLPFLVISQGFYGFLCAGLPFWVLRGCMCCMCCAKNFKLPESERPSNKVRFKRGATQMMTRNKKVQPDSMSNSLS